MTGVDRLRTWIFRGSEHKGQRVDRGRIIQTYVLEEVRFSFYHGGGDEEPSTEEQREPLKKKGFGGNTHSPRG